MLQKELKVRKTIVLIDDDHDDHEIFTMALDQLDEAIECIYYDSAREAFQAFTEETITAADYIFLDLNMPGMSGMQFLENMQKHYSQLPIPVIVYSTSMLPSNKSKVLELGATDFFIKPHSHKELIQILKALLISNN